MIFVHTKCKCVCVCGDTIQTTERNTYCDTADLAGKKWQKQYFDLLNTAFFRNEVEDRTTPVLVLQRG